MPYAVMGNHRHSPGQARLLPCARPVGTSTSNLVHASYCTRTRKYRFMNNQSVQSLYMYFKQEGGGGGEEKGGLYSAR